MEFKASKIDVGGKLDVNNNFIYHINKIFVLN